MKSDVWKEFEGEVTHSVAHHLAAVSDLAQKQGYARVSDVARYLGITRGSASLTLKALKDKGYVLEDRNKFLRLSEESQRIVDTVLARRMIVMKFLTGVLHMEEKQAEIDACKIEHLLSQDASERLLHFVRFLLSGAPVAHEFLQAFWEEKELCDDLETCPVCEDTCLSQAYVRG